MMTTTLPSIANQTTKVKRPREGGFCLCNFFFLGFVIGPFFFFYVSIKHRILFSFYHQEFWLLLTN